MNKDKLQAYDIVEERELDEIKAKGYILSHKKTKAKVICIECDDNNKVFTIGFKTPPTDDTGVAHIIEHTVLCGSKKYPVKDPFIELVKGSLNTFLNAMTYPDKTLYPIASLNDADFQNLLDVYMDAVFHPNIYNTDMIFKQEGWHYELDNPSDDLKINGVIYNEMKGAFSSEEGVLERAIMHSLYPDTSYGNESGGDPDFIPDLTYENYLNFHRKFYHPANSFIYLYGDMDMAEKLDYIDKEYLSDYDYLEVDSEIKKQKAFAEMAYERRTYPITESQSEVDNTTLSYNVVVGDVFDEKLSIAMQMIDYALMGMAGAPLKQALLDKGIGKDVSGTYEGGILQPYYSITAEMANESQKDEFIKTIRETLEKIVADGIDKKSLAAAINNLEFNYREMDFGRYPKGLMLGLRVYDSWIFGANDPLYSINCGKLFAEMRQLIDTDYYEKIVKEYLLLNTHGSVIVNVPVKGLTLENDNKLKEKLKDFKDTLSEEQIENIVSETKALDIYQSEPSPKEDLEKIPMLTRSDINENPEKYDVKIEDVDGVKVYNVNLFTNKISYITLGFDITGLDAEMLPYLTILKNVLSNVSTKNFTYDDLCNEIMLEVGELSYTVSNMYIKPDCSEYKEFFEVYIKCFDEKINKGFFLANEILENTLFDDYNRIYEILGELMSKAKNRILNSGNAVAIKRAQSYYSEKERRFDLRNGIGYYKVLEYIFKNYDKCNVDLVDKLKNLMKVIFRQDNLVVCFTHDYEPELIKNELVGLHKRLNTADDSGSLILSDKDSSNNGLSSYKLSAAGKINSIENADSNSSDNSRTDLSEGFITPSQIQFVCRAGRYESEYDPRFAVLSTILSYDYLWNNVRVKGGAYGCGANFLGTKEVLLTSYRDPNLKETNDIYEKLVDYVENFDCDDRDMTKYIIGTFSSIDTPYSTASKGAIAYAQTVRGRSFEERKADRIKILNANQEDIRNLAIKIKEALASKNLCCIGSEGKINEDKELFAKVVNLFE